MPTEQRLIERFWSKVEKTESCWLWKSHRNHLGYGRTRFKVITGSARQIMAYRVAYILVRGEIPTGSSIDHLCRNRACVNPWHLEAVSTKENCHRSDSFAGKNFRKTHCSKGHPFDETNTARHGPNKYRVCKICKRDRDRRYKLKIRRKGVVI